MLNSFLYQHMVPLIFAICACSKTQQPHLTTFLLKLPSPFFFPPKLCLETTALYLL